MAKDNRGELDEAARTARILADAKRQAVWSRANLKRQEDNNDQRVVRGIAQRAMARAERKLPVSKKQAPVDFRLMSLDKLQELAAQMLRADKYDWRANARKSQIYPEGAKIWLMLCGRGFGKTRAAVEEIRNVCKKPGAKVCMIAKDHKALREVCLEGKSGLIACIPPEEIKKVHKGLGDIKVELVNGSVIIGYTAMEPDAVRGAAFDCIAAGEFVETQRGAVPIELVVPGDYVVTRAGWRPVTHQWLACKGVECVRVTSGDASVVCTPDHRVWTETRGWVAAVDLAHEDVILCQTWKNECAQGASARSAEKTAARPWSLARSLLTDMRCAVENATPESAWRTRRPGGPGTPKGGTHSVAYTMLSNANATSLPGVWRKSVRASGPERPNGAPTIQNAGWKMTASRLRGVALGWPTRLASVPSRLRFAPCREFAPVGPSAPSWTTWSRSPRAAAPTCTTSNSCAFHATNTSTTACRQPVLVARSSIRVEPAGRHDVYDLTVEEHHEFTVGDILVTNCIWGDEFAAWPKNRAQDMLDQALMTMRESEHGVRCILSTTPKRIPHVVEMVKLALDPTEGIVVTRGSSRENTALTEEWFRIMERKFGGTRLGRQELDGELVLDVEHALWTGRMMDEARWPEDEDLPVFSGVITGVDPSGSKDGDATGIVTVGWVSKTKQLFVLDNPTTKGEPMVRYSAACMSAFRWNSTEIWYESAYGGDNAAFGIEQAWKHLQNEGLIPEDRRCPRIQKSTIKGDKAARAMPVVALYEQQVKKPEFRNIWHVQPTETNNIASLEDQMVSWETTDKKSPNDIDAAVHACRAIMRRLGMEAHVGSFANPLNKRRINRGGYDPFGQR